MAVRQIANFFSRRGITVVEIAMPFHFELRLIAAHDSAVSKASLFLTAGSLADMVWTGRATRLIRNSLEPDIELTDLRRAWGPLKLEN